MKNYLLIEKKRIELLGSYLCTKVFENERHILFRIKNILKLRYETQNK